MRQAELLSVGIPALVVLLSPIAPTALLLALDSLFVKIALVAAFLWATTQGPLLGVLALLAIGSLYLERNRRKVNLARKVFAEIPQASDPPQATVEEEAEPQDTVPVVAFDEPSGDIATYLPKGSMGSNEFAPVAPTLNEKDPLPTVPLGAKSAVLFKSFVM
jgi:hypothetical protein